MVEIPLTAHHHKARKLLDEAVVRGDMSEEESLAYYKSWLQRRRELSVMARHLRMPGDIQEDPQFKRVVDLLQMPKEEFDRACPPFSPGVPAFGKLSSIGKRMIRILGPTIHDRTAWKILGMMVDAKLMDYATMMETYRVWGSMVRSATRRRRR